MFFCKRGLFIVATLAFLTTFSAAASEAELGKDKAGRPVVLTDGAPTALMPGCAFADLNDDVKFAMFSKAGLKTVVPYANLGAFPSTLGYVSPVKSMREFWRGKNEYDKSDVEKLMTAPLKANPDTKIIIWLGFCEYYDFGYKNPDDIIRNDKGEEIGRAHV